ncbi:MAG: hypothetical protein Kow0079_14360 [Vicingaceae bacterium]
MKKLIYAFVIIGFTVACSNSNNNEQATDEVEQNKELTKEDLITNIENLESKLYANKDKYDTKLALEVLDAYKAFLKKYPSDEKSPAYTFKAGEIAMSLNKSQEAIAFFTRVNDNYKEFDKSSYALFLTAFVYDTQVKDYTQARKYYEAFINKYPNHELIDDAKASLQNLGKTPEELIEEFKKKNQSA